MFLFEGAKGLKIRTSHNDLSCLLPQNPFMAISSLAPSSTIDEAPLINSPVRGCKSGSIDTLHDIPQLTDWQSSLGFHYDVVSESLLWGKIKHALWRTKYHKGSF